VVASRYAHSVRPPRVDLLAETVRFAELVGILQETVVAHRAGAILQMTPRYQRLFARGRPVIRGVGRPGPRVLLTARF
jgi:hypothetical protein